MPEQSVVRDPARPMTRALRAAATVVIAIGASGVVAQLAPQYGPLYAYLAAVAAIAWLEGVVVALIGAAAVLAAYELVIAPATLDLRSWTIVGSLTGLMILAVGFIRHLRRPQAAEVKVEAVAPPDSELPAVRAQLAGALAKLYEANQQRAAEATAAKDREMRLGEQYEQENEHTQRAAALALEDVERVRQENEELRRRVGEERAAATFEEVERVRQGNEELRRRVEEERVAATFEEVERVRQENEELRRRIGEERAACEHLDAVWGEKLQKIVAELATDHENDLGEAVAQREEARAEARSLQMKINTLQHPATKSAPARRPLILVVHHDPTMRSMSRDSLDKGGFETITAADGLEGLRLTVAHKPDVVIADASMPKMDGRELCQLIKSNQETAGVKVVLITADARDEVSRELGPDELLRKPVKFDALHAVLTRLVGSA